MATGLPNNRACKSVTLEMKAEIMEFGDCEMLKCDIYHKSHLTSSNMATVFKEKSRMLWAVKKACRLLSTEVGNVMGSLLNLEDIDTVCG
jgi:hypothetical protein